MHIVDEILSLFETRGSRDYLGEAVSQREHALEAADLAVRAEAPDALVVAALLHDIGHLLGPVDDPADRGLDGLHEEEGSRWLSDHFGENVTEPIRLHVMAKRYLCGSDATYFASLSPASIRSLELQGGPLGVAEMRWFETNPHHHEAIRLRRWDEAAKIPGLQVPNVSSYTELLRRILIRT